MNDDDEDDQKRPVEAAKSPYYESLTCLGSRCLRCASSQKVATELFILNNRVNVPLYSCESFCNCAFIQRS